MISKRMPIAVTALLLSVAPALSAALADPVENRAKGTKTCMVWAPESDVFADVAPDGSIGLAVEAETRPGSNVYFLIDGKRYSGPASMFLAIDAAPLLGDPVIEYSYTNWPGAEVMGDTVIYEFAAAYDKCVKFLAG